MDRHHRHRGGNQLAKQRRRRRKMVAVAAVCVMMLGFVVLAGTYFMVDVKLPKDLQSLSENSTIMAADGKTVLAKVGEENRRYVKIGDIPDGLEKAVVTAEDRSFYTNSGIDVKGILRAAWNNVTDDDVEGASTITQQYARNVADLTRDQSYTRKLKEAVMAVKLNQQYEKDEILEFYLNTIYFGRGAYGVGAASEAYFGKPVEKLSVSEGALLASVIKNPTGYDPENDPDGAKDRWTYIVNSMVKLKYLGSGERSKAKFPKTQSSKAASKAQFGRNTPSGFVYKYVVDELSQLDPPISAQQLGTGGYTITTTINPKMQKAAERAVAKALKPHKKRDLASALVAVQPGTGRVMAYYGGKDGTGWDNAGWNGKKYDGGHQPGSSFKAYVLATALENGASINSYWDGYSPKEFDDRESPVRNSENNNKCKRCTLERATVLSLNTTYYGVTHKYGKEKVIDLANKAGIRVMKTNDLKPIDLAADENPAKKFGTEVGIGQYPVTVLDNANGFATFAAKGVAAKAHFVDKVMQDEKEIHKAEPQTTQAFSPETAADATHVLSKIPGSGGDSLVNGRPAAGKTGTWQFNNTDDNAHAWMAGYTPQLATAVWMGRSGDDGPIKTKYGERIYGSGLPADIWKTFMDAALSGKPVKEFPDPVYVGDETAGDAKSPPPPSPTPGPSTPPGTPGPGPSTPGGPSDPTETDCPVWGCRGRD